MHFRGVTHACASRGAQRDWPVSQRLRSLQPRLYACHHRGVFGGQHTDRLAQVRRPHGGVGRAHARNSWHARRDQHRRSKFLPLAGAGRMPGLPRSCFIRARLSLVSYWAVRAALDALDRCRVSRRARPCHVFPKHPFRAESRRYFAFLSRVSRRGGDACTRPTLPLPACLQSTPTSADQMGGLRSRCAM